MNGDAGQYDVVVGAVGNAHIRHIALVVHRVMAACHAHVEVTGLVVGDQAEGHLVIGLINVPDALFVLDAYLTHLGLAVLAFVNVDHDACSGVADVELRVFIHGSDSIVVFTHAAFLFLDNEAGRIADAVSRAGVLAGIDVCIGSVDCHACADIRSGSTLDISVCSRHSMADGAQVHLGTGTDVAAEVGRRAGAGHVDRIITAQPCILQRGLRIDFNSEIAVGIHVRAQRLGRCVTEDINIDLSGLGMDFHIAGSDLSAVGHIAVDLHNGSDSDGCVASCQRLSAQAGSIGISMREQLIHRGVSPDVDHAEGVGQLCLANRDLAAGSNIGIGGRVLEVGEGQAFQTGDGLNIVIRARLGQHFDIAKVGFNVCAVGNFGFRATVQHVLRLQIAVIGETAPGISHGSGRHDRAGERLDQHIAGGNDGRIAYPYLVADILFIVAIHVVDRYDEGDRAGNSLRERSSCIGGGDLYIAAHLDGGTVAHISLRVVEAAGGSLGVCNFNGAYRGALSDICLGTAGIVSMHVQVAAQRDFGIVADISLNTLAHIIAFAHICLCLQRPGGDQAGRQQASGMRLRGCAAGCSDIQAVGLDLGVLGKAVHGVAGQRAGIEVAVADQSDIDVVADFADRAGIGVRIDRDALCRQLAGHAG